MAENGFNKDDLLSLGDLLKDRLREVNEAREELNNAAKKLDDFVEKKFVKPNEVFIMSMNSLYVLCRFYPSLALYFRMVQTRRHLSTREAVALAEKYKIAKERTVLRHLKKLYSLGLIRKDEYGKYWAIPPSRLVLSDIV
ncbi:MAG: hypothetical protein NWE89_11740 [Candidatus Bathyarchaeota archaeon]|nr:hypothetical protein [Candidatus Bathyarchaeota archaeon]